MPFVFRSMHVTKARSRRGMQLLELVVSLASASLLMAGMTSAILIANRSAEIAWTRQSTSTRNIAGLDRLRADLAEAYPATNRTATQATLSVNDRNGDGNPETIQYQWNGAGSPLQRSVNAGAWLGITENLDSFNLDWRTCLPQSTQAGATQLEPAPSLVFQSRTVANTFFPGTQLAIDIPRTYQASDLLVAAISVQGNQGGSIVGPNGWTKTLEINNGTNVSLGVWVTFSNSLPQATFTWSSSKYAFATIAHFRVDGGSAALTNFATLTGTGTAASTPSSAASIDNSLVIRVLAATGSYVGEEATNMPGHVAITLRYLPSLPIIGMCYRTYAAGVVPAADFGVSSTYATATLVFQP